MLKEMKERVFMANTLLVSHGLVVHTWGNVSGRDPETGLIVIKPSGISYGDMKPEDMVVTDIEGNIVEGVYRPSTDTPTHLHLYKVFKNIGGVVHTHSAYATSWAQAGKAIPPFGTTHADHYHGEVPCTRLLTDSEIQNEYELNTGKVITELFSELDPLAVPSVLVNSHGPFCWGADPESAVHNAIALEEIARIALYTIMLGRTESVNETLLNKHHSRKHGKNAYYGQSDKK